MTWSLLWASATLLTKSWPSQFHLTQPIKINVLCKCKPKMNNKWNMTCIEMKIESCMYSFLVEYISFCGQHGSFFNFKSTPKMRTWIKHLIISKSVQCKLYFWIKRLLLLNIKDEDRAQNPAKIFNFKEGGGLSSVSKRGAVSSESMMLWLMFNKTLVLRSRLYV